MKSNQTQVTLLRANMRKGLVRGSGGQSTSISEGRVNDEAGNVGYHLISYKCDIQQPFQSVLVQSRLFYILQIATQGGYGLEQQSKNMNANTQQLKVTVTGLDLGSSSSKIAAVDKGTVDIITNEANLRQTPTLVAYGDHERLLGQSAHAKIKSNFANTIAAPHRYLGFSHSQFTTQESKLSPCRPKQENGVLVFGVSQQQKKQKLLAEQVTAAFLTKINEIVELNKLSNKFLVLAVPDYLTHHERKALLDALLIARENASTKYGFQLINQSAAIGLDYGFYKKNQFPEKEEDAQVTLFIDFGHNKLSAYAIKFTKKYQKVIYGQHERQLGCKNFDELMYQFYSSLFQNQNNDLQIGVGQSKKATLKLLQNIEKQRKVLSGNSEFDFNIDCLLQERDLSYTMKREEFQQISQPILQVISKFFENLKEKLKQMGVSPANIELVGGGSRIPCFIRVISSVFGIEPSRTLNSSECIARGAALHSAMSSNLFRTQPYYSIQLSPYNLRLSWKGEGQTMQIQSNIMTLLEKSETMFSEKQISLDLKVTSKKMHFQIAAGEIAEGLQNRICSFWIEFADWNGQNMDKKLTFTLKFDDNKMLSSVSASQMKQKEQLLFVNEFKFVERLSQQKIKEFIVKEKEDKARDAKIIANYERKNRFQSQIYTLKQKAISIAQNPGLKDFVKQERVEQTLKHFSQLEANFQTIQNYQQEINKAQKLIKQFQSEIQSTQSRYMKVEEELKKFGEYIEGIVHGKVKNIRSYPAEQVEKMKQWVTSTLSELKRQRKCQQLATSLQEISSMRNVLKEKIEEYQAEELRKKQEQQKKFYQPKFFGNRQFYREPYETPFGAPYDSYEPRTRARNRNTSFGGFNPFSGFF